jgi:hypothetical protein
MGNDGLTLVRDDVGYGCTCRKDVRLGVWNIKASIWKGVPLSRGELHQGVSSLAPVQFLRKGHTRPMRNGVELTQSRGTARTEYLQRQFEDRTCLGHPGQRGLFGNLL